LSDSGDIPGADEGLNHKTGRTLAAERVLGETNGGKDMRAGVENMSVVEETSQRLLEGILSLRVDLCPCLAVKIGVNYTGMAPIGRFKSEALGGVVVNGDEGSTSSDEAPEDPICPSCRTTVGDDSNEGGHVRSESSS